MFSFVGSLPSSKSLVNRALILKSFYPELEVQYQSQSMDVQKMEAAVEKIIHLDSPSTDELVEFDCGEAGTVLRFLAFRLCHLKGRFRLTGKKRLFERPQDSFLQILPQVGAFNIQLNEDSLEFSSEGWKPIGDAIHVSFAQSSQFVSGLLLSSWGLKQSLAIALPKKMKSTSYLKLTQKFLATMGHHSHIRGPEVFIGPDQKWNGEKYTVEPDIDCAFAVAAMAALGGEARLSFNPFKSLQPDKKGFELLKPMEIRLAEGDKGSFSISQTDKIKPIQTHLENAPDLFPVLSVLCAFASGESRLEGAEHLIHKESNRIDKTFELLKACQIPVQKLKGGVSIQGVDKSQWNPDKAFVFDPDQDHRMAMAAGILKSLGAPIQIEHPEVVNKSFPGFFEILGVSP